MIDPKHYDKLDKLEEIIILLSLIDCCSDSCEGWHSENLRKANDLVDEDITKIKKGEDYP